MFVGSDSAICEAQAIHWASAGMNGGQRLSPWGLNFWWLFHVLSQCHPVSCHLQFLQGTHLQINPKDFPNAQKEIAVPTLVMELKEALEALKPKPKEQAGPAGMMVCLLGRNYHQWGFPKIGLPT